DFSPAIDYTGGATASPGAPVTVGYSFTTGASPVTIDALGLNTITPPTGETVRIYLDGTSTNLASVAIPAASPTSSTTANGHTYKYQAIPPLTLLPSTTYDIVFDSTASDIAAIL